MWSYVTNVKWESGEKGIATTVGRPALSFSPPPEFGGTEDRWNPELMLVSAVESCILLTALSVLNRQKIPLKAYESKAEGRMEKTPEGLRFTGIDITIRLTTAPEDTEKARKAIAIAEKYCPVSNAVKCPVRVSVSSQ